MAARSKPFWNWFERLNSAYQVCIIALFFLGIFGAVGGTAVAIGVRWLDRRIAMHNEPLKEMLLYDFNDRGRLEGYLEYKRKKEAAQKAVEMRQTSIPMPLEIWQRRN